MRDIWIISDTHFGHENMVSKLTGPDGRFVRHMFTNADECDTCMKDHWTDIIKPSVTGALPHVYHLGDVAMKKPHLQQVKGLCGRKRLVRGNHDIFDTKDYLDVGFEEIYGVRVLENLIMSHIPLHPDSIGGVERKRGWIGNVHGHLHNNPSPAGRYLNVCVEHTEFKPLHIDEVVARMRKHVDTLFPVVEAI